jgi:hypothetical protein
VNRYEDPRVPVPAHRGCHGGKKLLCLLSRFLAEQIRPEIIGLDRNLVPHIVATHWRVGSCSTSFYSGTHGSVTGLQ